jgi:hypothetical protein
VPHDRTGERIEEDDIDADAAAQAVAVHRRYCSGWIDRDADHPVPCLVCKPHLAPIIERQEASR